jgi:flagellar motor switch protein FliM
MQIDSTNTMAQTQMHMRKMDGSGKGNGMREVMQSLSDEDKSFVREQMETMSSEDRQSFKNDLLSMESSSISSYLQSLRSPLEEASLTTIDLYA